MECDFTLNQIMNASRIADQEKLESHFNFVADKIFNHVILQADSDSYRLTEIEFYFFNEKYHPDPFIHNHPLQNITGHWYFHGSGLDITFGDGINFGGILLRGMKHLNSENNTFISGPLNVVSSLFNSFGNMSVKEHCFHIIENNQLTVEEIFKSTRVGLKEKLSDYYHNKYYRYLTFPFMKEHGYVEKTKVANALLNSERQIDKKRYTADNINSLFGWKIINI